MSAQGKASMAFRCLWAYGIAWLSMNPAQSLSQRTELMENKIKKRIVMLAVRFFAPHTGDRSGCEVSALTVRECLDLTPND